VTNPSRSLVDLLLFRAAVPARAAGHSIDGQRDGYFKNPSAIPVAMRYAFWFGFRFW
jgi:hypothetical protein